MGGMREFANDIDDMNYAREQFIKKHPELTNAHLRNKVSHAWTWGWVIGKEYFKEKAE